MCVCVCVYVCVCVCVCVCIYNIQSKVSRWWKRFYLRIFFL